MCQQWHAVVGPGDPDHSRREVEDCHGQDDAAGRLDYGICVASFPKIGPMRRYVEAGRPALTASFLTSVVDPSPAALTSI